MSSAEGFLNFDVDRIHTSGKTGVNLSTTLSVIEKDPLMTEKIFFSIFFSKPNVLQNEMFNLRQYIIFQ